MSGGQLEATRTLDQEIVSLDGMLCSAKAEWRLHMRACDVSPCPHQEMKVLNHMLDDRLGFMQLRGLEESWDQSGGNSLYRGGDFDMGAPS